MTLSTSQIETLKKLMISSGEKGNLATAAIVLDGDEVIASSESLVASDHDATAHAETLLVREVGKMKGNNYTPGLRMISVVESCTMCMSACSQAGFSEICYMIPADRFSDRLPYMTDVNNFDKSELAEKFLSPLKLTHLAEYEEDFANIFKKVMSDRMGHISS